MIPEEYLEEAILEHIVKEGDIFYKPILFTHKDNPVEIEKTNAGGLIIRGYDGDMEEADRLLRKYGLRGPTELLFVEVPPRGSLLDEDFSLLDDELPF